MAEPQNATELSSLSISRPLKLGSFEQGLYNYIKCEVTVLQSVFSLGNLIEESRGNCLDELTSVSLGVLVILIYSRTKKVQQVRLH